MKYIFHEATAYCRWRKCLQIMRLSIVFTLAFVLHAGAHGTAQTVTLSVNNMPLENVCKEIEKQTGYFFVYAKNLNKNNTLVSISFDHAPIEEALRQIFQQLPFSYQVIDKVVVVNTAVKFETPTALIAKESPDPDVIAKLQGRVVNELKQPLSGASVTNIATGKITLTNNKGEFTLAAVPVKSIIKVTYIGYAPRMVKVDGTSPLEIQLMVAQGALDETVVKGYYNTSNRLNTGNVSIVKAEDIARQPVLDPIQALEGRVPGLFISQSSGIPGASSSIRLRGQNSFYDQTSKTGQANDPLYIVDGVPFSSKSLSTPFLGGDALGSPADNGSIGGMSPFQNLNPTDIESIAVLKDADATAIYGSRGANGVIIITTKKGKIGKTKVDVNMLTGGSKATRLFHLLNTKQYLAMRHEAFKNDGVEPDAFQYDVNGRWDTTRYTDWEKVLIGNTARFTNTQVTLSGGQGNTQFLIGGGYTIQGTNFLGNFHDHKASGHFNINHTSENRRFNVSLTGNYVNDMSDLPSSDLTSQITLPPDAPPLFDANGNLNWQILDGAPSWANPASYTLSHSKSETNTLIGDLNLSYHLLPDLELKSSFGYTHGEMNQTLITPAIAVPPPFDTDPNSRIGFFSQNLIQTWIVEPQLTYRKIISRGTLDLLLGSTFQNNFTHYTTYYTYGYTSDALIGDPTAAASFKFAGNQYTQYRYNAFYGRVGYNWDEKYLLNLTGRRDGSSRFGPGRQFGNFGAVGIGWIFSKENFIQNNLSFLSFGKLRISYGSTGSDNLQDYYYLSTYAPIPTTYQGITGLSPTRLTNPNFAWESVKKFEAAIELGLLKDRITLTASLYRNKTENQLVGYPLPSIAGFSTVEYNLPAIIQNSGIECTLSTINIRTKNFSWTTSANIAAPRNKLVAFPNISQYGSYDYLYKIGQSLSIRKLYHFTGVNPQTGLYSVATKSGGNPSSPGDWVITNGATQNFYGAIQNIFNYKGFQLAIFFQFVKQTGYNSLNTLGEIGGPLNQPDYILGRWQRPGDFANIQKFSQEYSPVGLALNNFAVSDGILTDASFVRLKNLSISYELPFEIIKKAAFQSIRVYFQCQNLWTITKYQGMDPETGGGLSLPPLRTVTGGIQIQL